MDRSFKDLFLSLVKISFDLSHKGILHTKVDALYSDITSSYLQGAVNYVKEGYTPDIVDCYLDSELQIIMKNHILQDRNIRELYIIKHTFKYIREESIDNIIMFARPYVTDEEYGELWYYN
ncbi:MAG: hypothetical protein RSB66_08280, partial [Clostridium sp.]